MLALPTYQTIGPTNGYSVTAMASATETPRAVAALPSWLVAQVAQHGHRLVGDALAERGMRKHHFTTLMALQETGPTSQADLGRRTWIDRSDLHAVVGDLEREGLVTRRRDAADRRRTVVALTPAGAAALEQLSGAVASAQETLLTPLGAAERAALVDLLGRIAEHHSGQDAR
jgi:DNA-binding MarR family transcriptional regulator